METMKTTKKHCNATQAVIPTRNMPEIAIPATPKHLAAFGLTKKQDDWAVPLARLVDFKETVRECETPREKAALMKRFPHGLKSRSLLRLEFLGAGMGGCGAMDVCVLWNPSSGVELLCWLDLENSGGDVLASLVSKDLWLSAELIRLALKSLGPMAVANSALTAVENRIPRHFSRENFHRIWLELAREASVDTDQSIALLNECYSERNSITK